MENLDIAGFEYKPEMEEEFQVLTELMAEREDIRLDCIQRILKKERSNSHLEGLSSGDLNNEVFRTLYSYLETQPDLWGFIQTYKNRCNSEFYEEKAKNHPLHKVLDAHYLKQKNSQGESPKRESPKREAIEEAVFGPEEMVNVLITDMIMLGDKRKDTLSAIMDKYQTRSEKAKAVWDACEDYPSLRDLYRRLLSGKNFTGDGGNTNGWLLF
jgi:hypothetical protein